MEIKYNKLFLDDKGNGNAVIKINNYDITQGILEYRISRTAEDDEFITLNLKIKLIPEYVNIQLKKNSKSSNN